MPEIIPTGEQQQLAKLIDVRIQEKFDTLANWEKNNPVLLRGEMGFAALDINNDMSVGNIRVKIGDGKHTWNELGWGALGPTGVNIHMTKEPVEIVEVDEGKKEGTVVYDSIISGPAEVKVGDFVIDHITTESDNMYEAGWDGTIGFYRIIQVNDNEKAAIVEPWGDPMIVKGKWGATGPTGANPAMAIKLQNTDYIRSYNLDTKCGWFYGTPGNTVHDKPSGVDSFTLCVYRKGDNQYIHELYDQNNRIWIETYNGTQWTDWKEKAVGIASVSGSFNFTNKGNSATNTGTIKVTLDDVAGTVNSHTYEVRNGIGIEEVELQGPASVNQAGSAGNTYNLKVNKSAGGTTNTLPFTVYNGNGITAMQAVAVSKSDKDSGTSSYKIQYKHTADNSTAWHDITNGTFTVQNGQGLVKMDVTGALVSGGGKISTFTLRAYYSDNQSTPVSIGTFQVQNGKDIASLTLTSTESTASGVRSVTYTLSAKYSDGSSGQAGTFTVKDGVGISAAKITGGGNTASGDKNTYTLTLTKTDGKTLASTFDVYNGAKGDLGPTGPTGLTGPTGPTGSTPANAKLIPNGTDLNTYTYDKAGWYYAGGGNNCLNRPSGIDAFGLEVLRSAQGWTVQICYPSNNSTNKMFIRNSDNGSWTAWQEKGVNGTDGDDGRDGYTWIPNINPSGIISWTSTQAGPGATPASQSILGPTGPQGINANEFGEGQLTPIIFLSGGVDDYDNFISGTEITGLCIWDSRQPYLAVTEGTLGIISLNLNMYLIRGAYQTGKYEKEIKLNNQIVVITGIIGMDESTSSFKTTYRCTFRKLANSGFFNDYPPLFLEKASQGSSLVPIIALGNSLASTSATALNFDATVLLSRSAMSVSNIDNFGLWGLISVNDTVSYGLNTHNHAFDGCLGWVYDLQNPGTAYVPVVPSGTNFLPQYYLYQAKVMIPLSVTGTFTTPGQPIRIGVQGATGARGPTGPTGPDGKGFKNISLSNGILTLTW